VAALGAAAPAALAAEAPPSPQWVLNSVHAAPSVGNLATARTNIFYTESASDEGPGGLFSLDTQFDKVYGPVDPGVGPQQTTASVNETTSRMYVPAAGSHEVVVIDTAWDIKRVTSISDPTWTPYGTAVDPVRNTVYVVDANDAGGNASGFIHVIDGATNTVIASVPADEGLRYPAVSAAQSKLFVPVETADKVLVFDTQTNTIVDEIHGTTPGSLVRPTMAIADDEQHRLFVLNANTSGTPGGYGTVSVIDTETNAVLVDAIELPADWAISDRFSFDHWYKKITIGASANEPIAAGAAGPTGAVLTIDSDTLTFVNASAVPAFGAVDAVVDRESGRLFASLADAAGDSAGVYAVFDWRLPDPAPAPVPDGAPAANEPAAVDRLPDTGSDPAPLGWAVAFLVVGALAAVVGRRRRWAAGGVAGR
jgi:DNA-binding beta-propeller fold protein YncE